MPAGPVPTFRALTLSLFTVGLYAFALLAPGLSCAANAQDVAPEPPAQLPAPLESVLPDIVLPPLDEIALALWDAKQRALLAASRTMPLTLARTSLEASPKTGSSARGQGFGVITQELAELRRVAAAYNGVPAHYGVLDEAMARYLATAEILEALALAGAAADGDTPARLYADLGQQRETLAVLAAKLARALAGEDIRAYGLAHGRNYQWHHRRLVHTASELGLLLIQIRAVRGTGGFTDDDIAAFRARAARFDEACREFSTYLADTGPEGLRKEARNPLDMEDILPLRAAVKSLDDDFSGGLHQPQNPLRRYFAAGVSSLIEMSAALRHRAVRTGFSPASPAAPQEQKDATLRYPDIKTLALKARLLRQLYLVSEKTTYFIDSYSELPRYRSTLPPFHYVHETLPLMRDIAARGARLYADPADEDALRMCAAAEELVAAAEQCLLTYAPAERLLGLDTVRDDQAHNAIRDRIAAFTEAREALARRLALHEASLLLEDLRAVQKQYGLCYYLLHFKVLVSAKAVVALLPTDNSSPINVPALDAAFVDFDKSAAALDAYFAKAGPAGMAAEARHPITPVDCATFSEHALTALESARLGLAKVYNGPVFFVHEAFRDLCRKAAQTRFTGPRGVLEQLPGCGDSR